MEQVWKSILNRLYVKKVEFLKECSGLSEKIHHESDVNAAHFHFHNAVEEAEGKIKWLIKSQSRPSKPGATMVLAIPSQASSVHLGKHFFIPINQWVK